MTPGIEVPVRWSDLDSYRHINNAALLRLVEHAFAVQRQMPPTAPFNITVEYLRPIRYEDQALIVTTAASERGWVHDVAVAISEDHATHQATRSRVTCARVTYQPARAFDPPPLVQSYAITIRPSDFTAADDVAGSGLLDLVQESRMALFADFLRSGRLGAMAVVAVSANAHRRSTWQARPRPAHVWVGRVGRSSLHVETAFVDESISASSVLVAIDAASGHKREWTTIERSALDPLLAPSNRAPR